MKDTEAQNSAQENESPLRGRMKVDQTKHDKDLQELKQGERVSSSKTKNSLPCLDFTDILCANCSPLLLT